jgi:hypothetical protein
MVKYRAVSFKKDHIAALYFTMSDIVYDGQDRVKQCCRMGTIDCRYFA